jgi:hypothetical protein
MIEMPPSASTRLICDADVNMLAASNIKTRRTDFDNFLSPNTYRLNHQIWLLEEDYLNV